MDDYILESPVRLRYVFAPPTYYPHISLYVDNRCRHANGLQIALDFEVITFQFIFFSL